MGWLRCSRCLLGLVVVALVAGCGANIIPGVPPSPGGGKGPGPGKTNPVITWPTPAPITNPTPLSAAQLDATANVAGTFAYTPTAGTVLAPGTQTLSTTFTPSDTADYNTVTASVILVVNPPPTKTNPVITWPTPAPITNPTPLSAAQLDATANVAGTFAYTPAAGTVLAPGSRILSTILTPTDTTDYNTVTASVTLVVNPPPTRTNPVITWPTPAPITNPTPLSATQLDATASVAGTFAYTPAAGTVLPPGNQILSTTFTPTDITDYNTVTATVKLVVNAPASSCVPPAPLGGPSVQPGNGAWLAVADSNNNRVLIYPAPFTTDESAVVVLGQPDFSHNAPNQGCPMTANTLSLPTALAVDAAGNLYVADQFNCRVLQFRPPFTTDMSASLVIGQAGMDRGGSCSPTPAAGANRVLAPRSITFDSAGDMWVVDVVAARMTEYVPPFSNGMAATLAIGQPNLSSSLGCNGTYYTNPLPPNPTSMTLCGPTGAAFDSSGNLWVVEYGNSRALEFEQPLSTGMAATVELGHPPGPDAFDAGSCSYQPPTTSVCEAQAVTLDASGDLWVSAGASNSQISGGGGLIEFDSPFSDGMTGDVVISPQMNNGQGVTAQNAVPSGMFIDAFGNLVAVDAGASRVLIFSPPLGSGMSASVVIGEPTMTTPGPADCPAQPQSANTLCVPWGAVEF